MGGDPPNAVELQARKMDNRGSKSNTIMFVKEQRVDGSYTYIYIYVLRCTLRGFERITWAGVPSNKGLYWTTVRNTDSINFQPKLYKYGDSKNWFITGFTDGDGSFAVSIAKKKSGIGWKIPHIFTIGLDQKDSDLLAKLKLT